MLLLHTADWHLGRTFHRADLHDAQAAALDALVDAAALHRPDVVVVAGDLYDRAVPPVAAVRLANDALGRLAAHAPVVVITGNHDSPGRLGPYAPLLEAAGVHLRADAEDLDRPVLIEASDGPAAVYGIPYLEPDLHHRALDAAERSHAAVLAAAMRRVRADLATRRIGVRSIVVAHAVVSGATAGGSEREIAVGGVQDVSPATFAGVDYVALGHLHVPHAVGEGGRLRYAGSLLPYAFAEAGATKTAQLVELDAGGALTSSRPVPLPAGRRLGRLRGRLETLLADPALAARADDWLQVTLTDPVRPEAPMERLRERFPGVLVLRLEPEGATAPTADTYAERLAGLDDAQIAHRFLLDVRGRPAEEEERELLDRALAAQRVLEAV